MLRCLLIASLAALILIPGVAHAAESLPTINIGIGQAGEPSEVATSLKILFLLTVLSLAPAIVIMMTSFARVVVVLAFLRQALGAQQTPPNQIIIGLALFITFFIMAPVWKKVNGEALQPFLAKQVSHEVALQRAAVPIRHFMLRQTREKDLALFIRLSHSDAPRKPDEVPLTTLIPAFVISELKTAFQIGFILYLPFLILDMVVASVLLSMGMLMLPPILVSLPFKLMLFVMVDGWHLVVGSLIESFG